METWDAIRARRQVREFTDEMLAEDDLDQILEAGRRAPSARNAQPWDFVVVTDREQLSALSGVWRGAAWIPNSAVTVGIVVPNAEDGRQELLHRLDLGQVAMQMMIAAAGLGIASGQAACEDQALAAEVLGFPDDHHCGLLLAFGYPADRPLRPIVRPSRRPFDEVVHRGRW